MRKNRKPTGRAMSIPGGLAVGGLTSLTITLLSALVLAWLVDKERLLWEQVGYGILAALLLASFSGAIVAYQRIKRQRILVCAMSGTLYLATLLLITAMFFGGQYESVWATATVIAGGSLTAGLLGLHQSRAGKQRGAYARER